MPKQTKRAKCGTLSAHECRTCSGRRDQNCAHLPCGQPFLKFIRLFKKKDGWYYKFNDFGLNTIHCLGDVSEDEAKLKAIEQELDFWSSAVDSLDAFRQTMEQWKFERNIEDD